MGTQAMFGREQGARRGSGTGKQNAGFWSGDYELPHTLFGQVKALLSERTFKPLWVTLAIFAFFVGATFGVLLWWLSRTTADFAVNRPSSAAATSRHMATSERAIPSVWQRLAPARKEHRAGTT